MPAGIQKLQVTGSACRRTKAVIREFQDEVVGLRRPDGRVDPGGRTLGALNKKASAGAWAQQSKRKKSGKGEAPNVRRATPNTPLRFYDDPETLRVFKPHLRRREGRIKHFYLDSKGLVTIGCGMLVEKGANKKTGVRSESGGAALARALSTKHGIHFFHKDTKARATPDQIAADWKRVRDARGSKKPDGSVRRKARDFLDVAELRISSATIDSMLMKKLKSYGGSMFRRVSYADKIDTLVQIAIIDGRFNPAGVGYWNLEDDSEEGDPDKTYREGIARMWHLLNPNTFDFDPYAAADLFAGLYPHKDAGSRYMGRHAWRAERFREGAARMCATEYGFSGSVYMLKRAVGSYIKSL